MTSIVSDETNDAPFDEATPLMVSSSMVSRGIGMNYHYNDSVQDQTWGRRMATFLSKFAWYNPQGCDTANGNPKTPSLQKAWMHFEHHTLGRHLLEDKEEEGGKKKKVTSTAKRAEPGENKHPTRLYSVLTTKEEDLADFGIGVGVYFYTVRCLAYIMFIAGLISLPPLYHFAGGPYNGDEDLPDQPARFWPLRGSAICTDESWVPCPTCERTDWTDTFPSTLDRYAEFAETNSTVLLKFIKVNNCRLDPKLGFYTYVALWFVIVAIGVLRHWSKRKEIDFDENEQTSSDYTIEVTNPPKDAHDADEWKEFFSQFGHVVCCTVALDNEDLVKALMKRRGLVLQLQNLQPLENEEFDIASNLDRAVEVAQPLSFVKKLMMAYDASTLAEEIKTLNDEIQNDLAKRHYGASSVFITFDTEYVQQMTLETLAVSSLDYYKNNKTALKDPKHVFRNEYMLRVIEPSEPSSIRWQDLDETPLNMFLQRLLTGIISFIFIMAGCIIVPYTRYEYGPIEAAIAVTVINTIIPSIMTYLVSIEAHVSEGSRQASSYRKITTSMFVNTTLVTALITPFADTLSHDPEALLPTVYAIFFTELLRSPITDVADISGHVYRHIFGPRSPDQRRMNLNFSGKPYQLSERYTNMTNILFLAFWYSAIFPFGFFLAAAVFIVHYWSDKFCLLRSWAPAPKVGNKIAEFSRNYFFTAAVIVFSIVTSYNFAGFPFDNACPAENMTTAPDAYVGTFVAKDLQGASINVTITPDDTPYTYCNQDMMRYPIFPAIPSNQPTGGEWMVSDDQRLITTIFGWTSVLVTIGGILLMLRRTVVHRIKTFLVNPFVAKASTSPERFSDILDIFAYIPQVKLPGQSYPTLFCDVSKIDDELISWYDPDHSFDFHNAIYDLPILDNHVSGNPIFSTVHHWPVEKE